MENAIAFVRGSAIERRNGHHKKRRFLPLLLEEGGIATRRLVHGESEDCNEP